MQKRIVLVCPSSPTHTPYVDAYKAHLTNLGCDLVVFYWERFSNVGGQYTYTDGKVGHRRGFFKYYLYCRYVISRLKTIKCDGIVVFGIPLAFVLRRFLKNFFGGRFVIDVRDHHKLINFFWGAKSFFSASYMIVISSPRFRLWLPNYDRYVINHNTQVSSFDGDVERPDLSYPLRISCIGALKDLPINIQLIEQLRNDQRFSVEFRGEGVINEELIDYAKKYGIGNVSVLGRYNKEEELAIYQEVGFVNMLMTPLSVNNLTCLSNRLYNAAIAARPLLCLKGSYISDVVDRYYLGVSVADISLVKEGVMEFVRDFDFEKYLSGRREFLSEVLQDNMAFFDSLSDFVNSLTPPSAHE